MLAPISSAASYLLSLHPSRLSLAGAAILAPSCIEALARGVFSQEHKSQNFSCAALSLILMSNVLPYTAFLGGLGYLSLISLKEALKTNNSSYSTTQYVAQASLACLKLFWTYVATPFYWVVLAPAWAIIKPDVQSVMRVAKDSLLDVYDKLTHSNPNPDHTQWRLVATLISFTLLYHYRPVLGFALARIGY